MSSLTLALRLTTHLTAASALILAVGGVAHAVTMDWVTVGDPGNACDTQSQGCFGSVGYTYLISKYETTNAQYAEFLNAVAATDTNGLYHTRMGVADPDSGGITRSGSSGSYTYSTIVGREDMPVNWVSFYDNLRFANWLHNGQPTGAQDSTTTEDGAYTFSSATSVGARNAGATIFLPSEDEWYKAAARFPGRRRTRRTAAPRASWGIWPT
jgi:formylglycine-generating enzyme required for sulfatase activity